MRIEHNYLKELLDEEDQIDRRPADKAEEKQPAPKGNQAFMEDFVTGLIRMRCENHARKRADGLCMSVAEFEELAGLADELASCAGLDCIFDIGSRQGLIAFTLEYFDLAKDETPELIEALARLFARADRLSVNPVSKYSRSLVEISLLYDLDK